MTKVDIETNVEEVAGLVGRLFRDQVPFAISVAINDTAKEFQEAQRRHQRNVFDVKNTRFVDRAVKIKPFAKKSDPVATVRIDPPGGQARANILGKFETDIVKRPREGSRLAVPIDVRRTATGRVSKSLRPRNLELQKWGSKGDVARGKNRTWAYRRPGGRGAVFRRLGRGKSSRLRLLYVLKPRVPIRPDLDFFENARDIVQRRFDTNFDRAFDRAVRTAR